MQATEEARERGRPQAWWVLTGVALGVVAFAIAVVAYRSADDPMGAGSGMVAPHMGAGSMPAMGETGMLAGIARPAVAEDADRVVQVDALDALSFEPSSIEVSVGETVAFEVTNTGATTHEFMLAPVAMRGHHGEQMGNHGGMAMGDSPHAVTLEPGQTKTLAMEFVGPGKLEYGCHLSGHYEGGMVGVVRSVDA